MTPPPDHPSFWDELRSRRVVRAVVVYAIAAWVVVQVADTFFPALRLPEWTVTLVAALAVLGFPITVVLAWIFERTPQGLRRTPSEPPAAASTTSGGSLLGDRRLVLATALGALLGVALLGAGFWWGRGGRPAEPVGRPSVAVLPFDDFSPERDQAYLADGITEDILSRIARSDDMRVLSRTTVMAYRDSEAPLPEIAAELGVTHLLEGSVQRSGDQIRITVQLIDTSDTHLWADSWTGPLDDVFAMQSEIAEGVAKALAVELEPDAASARGTSADAYEVYLRAREVGRGRYASMEQATAVWTEAFRLSERAIALDSGFAAAWASAAEYATFVHGADSAADLAREAVRLDPTSDLGHTALGHVLAGQERFDAAVEQFRVATSINPNSPDAWYGLGAALHRGAQAPAEAWHALRRGAALGEAGSFSGSAAALILPFFLRTLGFYDEAAAFFRWVEEGRGQPGELECYLAETALLRGDSAVAVRHLREMTIHTGRGNLGLYCDGRVRFLLGDREAGLASMRAAAEQDVPFLRVWVGLMEASIAGPPADEAQERIASALAEMSPSRGFSSAGIRSAEVLARATAGDVEGTVARLRSFTDHHGPERDWRVLLASMAPAVASSPAVTAVLDENERRLDALAREVAPDLETARFPAKVRRYLREERERRAGA